MTKVMIKKWFGDKTICVRNGITLIWEKAKAWKGDRLIADLNLEDKADIEYFFNDANWEEACCIYGKITRETEKAVLLEADYWDFRYCRYVNDAKVKHGWKVWVPKSVIYKIEEQKQETA